MRLLTNFQATLQGRATSYWINAQADAMLSQEIVDHLKKKPTSSPQDHRFVQLIKLARATSKPAAFLAACAFTLWEVNGRMDWEVARLYAHGSNFATYLPSQFFASPSPTKLPLISAWLLPILGNQLGLHRFLRKHELDISIPSQAFRQALITVQEINIAHNLNTIKSMPKRSSIVSNKLTQLAQKSPNPQKFVQAAKNTQKAAIFWDKAFIRLL